MIRKRLPNRRFAETFDLKHGPAAFRVTVGYYEDEQVGEVFVSGLKSGADFEAVARDGAVLLSIALQYGVPLDGQHCMMPKRAGVSSACTRSII